MHMEYLGIKPVWIVYDVVYNMIQNFHFAELLLSNFTTLNYQHLFCLRNFIIKLLPWKDKWEVSKYGVFQWFK